MAKTSTRTHLTLYILNFDEIVSAARVIPEILDNAPTVSYSFNDVQVDTIEEVQAFAKAILGFDKKEQDAITEFESWRPRVVAIK